MHSAKLQVNQKCQHTNSVEGLALITLGNTLQGDDGIAGALCDTLQEHTLKDVCRFDLGTYTGYLSQCMAGHKAAIIVESTSNGTAPGTISLVDLSAVADKTSPLNVQSCHGFSLAEELRLAKKLGTLPKRIIFFGVEVLDTAQKGKVTPAVRQPLPGSVKKLSLLVSTILETLKRDA